MGASSAGFHEDASKLSAETQDMHRAIVSLMEELEAVDWYQQRVDAAGDDELRAILAHNRDEEIEHASMVLEWLRRRNPTFAENLGTYLDTTGPITAVETAATGSGAGGAPAGGGDGSLGIGSLKGSK
ncbi:MAG: ferritin [Alphaproteobacteria bacterium]|nr:ferritin [Alphaproteobacteria bacterium]